MDVVRAGGWLALDDEAVLLLSMALRAPRDLWPPGVAGLANVLVAEGAWARARIKENGRVHAPAAQLDATLGALGSSRHENGLTSEEAATRLGVTTGRIRHLIRTGRLKAHKIGRDWRIGPDAIEDYERRQGVRSVPRASSPAGP